MKNSSEDLVIEARELEFHHRYFKLGPLNLKVKQGERVVLIGANGSGKTTLLNMLARLKVPTRGSLSIVPEKKRSGFLTDNIVFPSHWPLAMCVNAYRSMNGISEKIDFDKKWSKTPFAKGSTGMKMQVLLKSIALQKPELLICDEPSSGLDPNHQQILLDNLANYTGTLVMSTHYFSELQRLKWDQCWLLKNGEFSTIPAPSSAEEWKKAFGVVS